jgi:hypothetical protein
MPRTYSHRIPRSGRAACLVSALVLAMPGLAASQQSAAPDSQGSGSRGIPRPDELEPAVNTTLAEPATPAVPAPAAPAPSAASAATAAPAEQTKPSAPAGPVPQSATAKSAPARQGTTAAAKAGPRKGPDRLELDPTDITGNRELPKVLYIVPWKRSDLGDVVGRPVNSLLDEVLQPLDRDVFQRENRYYDALAPGAGGAKAGAAQGSQNKP